MVPVFNQPQRTPVGPVNDVKYLLKKVLIHVQIKSVEKEWAKVQKNAAEI
jgi:hypothetical protein